MVDVTVTEMFQLADDAPDTGWVSFAPLTDAAHADPERIVTDREVVATLTGGAIKVELVASDDPGWELDEATMAAGGMPYRVQIQTGGLQGVWTVLLPAPGPHLLHEVLDLAAPPDVVTVPTPGPPGPAIDDNATSTDTTWSSAKVVSAIQAAIESALSSINPIGPKITVTGSVFAPSVELAPSSTATVQWWYDSEIVATGPSPAIDFGSSDNRIVTMQVLQGESLDFSDVLTLNLGFNEWDDAGWYNIGASYNKDAQPVSAISGLGRLTNLKRFCAANTLLTGLVDFSGLSDLEFIECFNANITSVNLTGCNSLIRLCLETNRLSTLDLNPVASTLRDLRAADQGSSSLTFVPLDAPMAILYHFCVRDQPIINRPMQMPAIVEYWAWNCGLTGTLELGPLAYSVTLYGNNFTGLDVSQASALWSLDLAGSTLPENDVNAALIRLAGGSVNNGHVAMETLGTLSTTAREAVATLLGRGWAVLVNGDTPTISEDVTAPSVPGDLDVDAVTATTATVSWSASTDDVAVTGYQVEVNGVGGSWDSGTFRNLGGLTADTEVTVRVRARDAAGNSSGWSSPLSFTTTTATPSSNLWEDDFDRADATGIAGVGNGWAGFGGHGANIVSNALQRTGAGYGLVTNPAGESLPADLDVEIEMPLESMTSFWGVVARVNSANSGVKVFFTDNRNTIVVGNAYQWDLDNTTPTVVNGFPAGWGDAGVHTLRVRMVGSTIDVYCDGVHSHTATYGVNSGLAGGSVGFCGEGANRLWNRITVETP